MSPIISHFFTFPRLEGTAACSWASLSTCWPTLSTFSWRKLRRETPTEDLPNQGCRVLAFSGPKKQVWDFFFCWP